MRRFSKGYARPAVRAVVDSPVAMLIGPFLVVAVGSGCAVPRRTYVPPADPAGLNDEAFVHYLATVPVATVDEGARAVLILVGTTSQRSTPPERWSRLEEMGAVREDWGLAAEDTLTMGTLAYMLRRVSGIPGGVNTAWSEALGASERRYALKACIDAGILPASRSADPVRGGELVAALSRAEKSTHP